MIVVKSLHFLQVALGVLHIAHTAVTEGEHILAVDEVLRVERIVPDEQVGQRDGDVIPVWNGVWYYPNSLVIEPYQQVVINICGAIDNTQTVTQSVNYANSDYYCMYDPESGYENTNYYPTPASVIPTSHYLKAKEIGLGNGWTVSVNSPAFFIFQTQGIDAASWADDVNNI